ncbi:MAG: phospholipase D-like domain-containing protein [Thermomonas sp.]
MLLATLHPSLAHALSLLHVAAVAVGLLLYVALTHSGRQRRPPSAALAWVIALVAFPYLALPAYLLLGTRKLAHAHVPLDPPPATPAAATANWASALTRGLDLPPPRHCAALRIEADGARALQALLDLLDTARAQIDIEVFLLRADAVGQPLAEALARAHARGVAVRVLLDGLGAFAGHRRTLRLLRGSGAQVRWFSPLRLRLHPQFGRGNLRNHRKLVVVDGQRLWTGGRNLAREYFLGDAQTPAWDDLSLLVDGGIARDAARLFVRDWALAGGDAAMPAAEPIDAAEDGALAQLLPSGPDRRDDTAYALLLGAIHRADARVLLATPYFVPDDALQLALVLAARRGVQVELLLPARSNHRLADIARARSLRELAAAGVRIHLLPRMLHAKAFVIDAALASAGSINLDGRSLFLNYELNVLLHDPARIDALAGWFAARRAESSPYAARAPGWLRDVGEGMVRALGFQL